MSLSPAFRGVWNWLLWERSVRWNSFSPQIVAGGTYNGVATANAMRSITVAGAQGAGQAVDTTKFAGAAWLRINRQAIAGAPGNLTITCNGYDASGAAFTGALSSLRWRTARGM